MACVCRSLILTVHCNDTVKIQYVSQYIHFRINVTLLNNLKLLFIIQKTDFNTGVSIIYQHWSDNNLIWQSFCTGLKYRGLLRVWYYRRELLYCVPYRFVPVLSRYFVTAPTYMYMLVKIFLSADWCINKKLHINMNSAFLICFLFTY